MSAPSAINRQRQIIVGGTPSTNTITTAGLKDAAFQASTNVGEIGIFTKEGTRVTEATAATIDEFVVAVSRGADLSPVKSNVIKKSTLTNVLRKVYAAATEQETYIGYNGTSGAIQDVATYAGDLYSVKVILQQFLSGSDDERIKNSVYKSLSTDGQAEVALGIVASLEKNMSREVKNSSGNAPVISKAICNVALASDFAFDNTGDATVVKGSERISFAGAPTYNTGTSLAVGDYLRIGSATDTNAAVALKSNVYKVVNAVSSTVFDLDRPVTAVSGTYVDTGGNITVIPSATGQAANWGILLIGQPLPWSLKKKRYSKLRMDVQPNSSFGSTTMGNTTSASEGTGTYEQVAELEQFLCGYLGEEYEMGEPLLFDGATDLRLASSSVAGGGYDLITLEFSNTHTNFQNNVAKNELVIAVPATVPDYADSANASDDLTDVLEVLAGLGATALVMT